jgi:hypothetical protein
MWLRSTLEIKGRKEKTLWQPRRILAAIGSFRKEEECRYSQKRISRSDLRKCQDDLQEKQEGPEGILSLQPWGRSTRVDRFPSKGLGALVAEAELSPVRLLLLFLFLCLHLLLCDPWDTFPSSHLTDMPQCHFARFKTKFKVYKSFYIIGYFSALYKLFLLSRETLLLNFSSDNGKR